MTLLPYFLLLLLLALLGGLAYWLFITTEGVFLGRRVVVWLYDRTAHRYDAIKEFDPADEQFLVARPLLAALAGRANPLLLDVATGTGRVPFDLLQNPAFPGRVIGLDASRPMLAVAASKLAPYGQRVSLVQHPAAPLPFPAARFDLVTCLEALEFFPSDEAALREMVRVLRPGGCLITTRRTGREGQLFLHRYRSPDQFAALLDRLGLTDVEMQLWEVGYDLVTARKPAAPTGDAHAA